MGLLNNARCPAFSNAVVDVWIPSRLQGMILTGCVCTVRMEKTWVKLTGVLYTAQTTLIDKCTGGFTCFLLELVSINF